MHGKCIRCFVTSKARRKKDQGFFIWKYVCWVELCPQKRNAEVLIPGTYDYDLIYSLSRCKHVKMRSFGWVLTQYDWCPCEETEILRPFEDTLTRRKDRQVQTEAETDWSYAATRAHGITRNWKRVPTRGWREHGPANTLTLDFWPPDYKTINFYCFKSPSLWHFVMAAQGN